MSQFNKSYYLSFYSNLDGVYSSFWLGKLTNLLVKGGKSSVTESQINNMLLSLKLYGILPINFVLENLLKIKPIFSVSSSVIHGKEQQAPVLLSQHKQLQLATRWISSLIAERKEQKLSYRVYNELSSINVDRRHSLVQRRDKIFKLVIKNRSSFRYSK